jgi:hypothetical protein
MARFTKELRQEIVMEFAIRHNGQFDAALFFKEVEAEGSDHRAHEWFTWDASKAALEHHLWQAREFAVGLKVIFTVEHIGRNKKVTLRQVTMPLVFSPRQGQRSGGGYVLTDPDSPEQVAELCRQAAVALRSWHARYNGALAKAGGSVANIETAIAVLEKAAPQAEAA